MSNVTCVRRRDATTNLQLDDPKRTTYFVANRICVCVCVYVYTCVCLCGLFVTQLKQMKKIFHLHLCNVNTWRRSTPRRFSNTYFFYIYTLINASFKTIRRVSIFMLNTGPLLLLSPLWSMCVWGGGSSRGLTRKKGEFDSLKAHGGGIYWESRVLPCGKPKIQLQFFFLSAVTLWFVYCNTKVGKTFIKAQLNSGTQQNRTLFSHHFLEYVFILFWAAAKRLFQTEKEAKLFVFMHLS
jgi:hypothetical protein